MPNLSDIERLYHDTLARAPSDRAAYLAQVCAGDESLRRDIESLLARRSVGAVLGTGGVELAAGVMASDVSITLVGRTLGAYRILSQLGAGGMGVVYRAHDTRLSRDVAIKVLPGAFTADRDRLGRFEREARLLAALNHPNIVTVFAVEQADGLSFLTMELVEGRPLGDVLPKAGLPLDRMLTIAIQVADAVAVAHHKGITHRDLKPANIMIGEGEHAGRVKVLDFGLAKLTGDGAAVSAVTTESATEAGRILGTVAYMSPEQAEGRPVDARSDLFSLGIILCEMATGQRPFTGDTSISIMSSIVKDTPKSVTELNPALPRDLARIVRRALTKDVTRRYQTAADLRNDLEELKASLDSGELALPPVAAAVPAASRVGWRWPLATAIAVLVTAVVAIVWRRPPPGLDLSEYRYRPFALSAEGQGAGVWSPDGKSIAFLQGTSLQPPFGALKVQSLDASVPTQLVDSATWPLAWSPDARIFFRTQSGVDAISTAGGQVEQILKGDVVNQMGEERRPVFFDLSPDGKTLAVWRYFREGRSSVWLSSPPGAQPRPYAPAPFAVDGTATPIFMRFSPDGRWLYLSTYAKTGPEVWLLPLPPGSGAPRRLFQKVIWKLPPSASWMPDNRRLVLAGWLTSSNRWVLWLADTRDESLRQLSDRPDSLEQPAVSPDGKHLLITSRQRNADIMEVPLDGSPPRKLLATALNENSPAWSPKGDQFAYVTERNGPQELWVRGASGESDRPVVTAREIPNLLGLSTPAFSLDGTRLAYTAVSPDAVFGLFISPAAGGTPTKIGEGTAPSWSPDGTSIAYVHSGGLATLRVGSSQPPVDIYKHRCESVQWSPSGEWIACVVFAPVPATVLVSPDGKVQRTLSPMRSPTLAWSKDSRTLYSLRNDPGQRSLLALDVRRDAVRTVATYGSDLPPLFAVYAWGVQLSRSPDGTSVAAGTSTEQSNLWILDGFAR